MLNDVREKVIRFGIDEKRTRLLHHILLKFLLESKQKIKKFKNTYQTKTNEKRQKSPSISNKGNHLNFNVPSNLCVIRIFEKYFQF